MGRANLPTSMSTATGADSNLNIGHMFPVMQTKHNRQNKKKILRKKYCGMPILKDKLLHIYTMYTKYK